jgi:UrcA family protein
VRISFSFTAASLVLMICFGAHADGSADRAAAVITGSSAVHYGDLNLNAEQDARTMLQRIERAAKTACGGHATVNSSTGTVDEHTFDECRAKAVQRAVKVLGASVVARIYLEAGA